METTEHRAGYVLKELLNCGALAPEDVAAVLQIDSDDVEVDVTGDVVSVTPV